MSRFADVKRLLDDIRAAVGNQGIVSANWDGDLFSVGVARPGTGKPLFQLRFDAPGDFDLCADDLIKEYALRCAEHFGG